MQVIYNSLSQKKESLQLIQPRQVGLYVCGMTVYDYCHVGHARVGVIFDMVVRFLRFSGFSVHYVRNITDIDDKIIHRAVENGEDVSALTARFIQAMQEDEALLGILRPDEEPRATQYIDQMVYFIQMLIQKKYAYVTSSGEVCFDVDRFSTYGELARQELAELQVGARVERQDEKHNPLDFVLWKPAKPGEPAWDSPWGKGRPGWHIECSAMSSSCLGERFDLHGGGIDLKFPHHQNEIAQSDGAFGHRCVTTWMHVGHVQVNQQKMSKSLGNFYRIRDVLTQYDPEVIRYFLLASHYRSPIDYSHDNLQSAQRGLIRWYGALRKIALQKPTEEIRKPYVEAFRIAMEDDFNTPVAFSVLFEIVRSIHRHQMAGDEGRAGQLAWVLKELGGILGFLQKDPQTFLRIGLSENQIEFIDELVATREKARSVKDWKSADALRDQLKTLHIVVEDTEEGPFWRKE